MKEINIFYEKLFSVYGPQGWWPLLDLHNKKGLNPTKTGSFRGYHPGDYSYPQTPKQRFEICVGAILTQNTNWANVEKALLSLRDNKLLGMKEINEIDRNSLAKIIKSAGYYNQKARKLKIFTAYYMKLRGRIPAREELLSLWGIGEETADSILLYAYKQPEFIVDAYTRRILIKKKIINEKWIYKEVKQVFHANLKSDYKLFQEYHALIVEHAKRVGKNYLSKNV